MFFPPLHSHHLGAMLGLVRCMSFFHNVYKHCGSVVLFKQCFVCLSILNSLWHRLNQWLKFWMRLCVRGSVMTQCEEGDVSSTEMLHLGNLLLYWSRAIFPHIFLLPGVKCCTLGNNDHSKGSERELKWIFNLWVAVSRIQESSTPDIGQTCNLLLIFGSNLSPFLRSGDLWMVSWCWASLYKISHLSDFSLRKKNLKDLALT